MLWLPLIAAAIWIGARWITPKVDPSVPTPAALSERLPANGMALVTFGAEWCAACKTLDPEVATFAQQHPEVRVITIDVDSEGALAQHYQIRAIPVMLLFRDGQLVDHYTGVKRSAGLSDWVAQSSP